MYPKKGKYPPYNTLKNKKIEKNNFNNTLVNSLFMQRE